MEARDFGNRGGRLVGDLVGVEDRHPRHQDHHGLAVLALLGPGDELVAPAHDLADVRKADQLELADDLLDRNGGASLLLVDVRFSRSIFL